MVFDHLSLPVTDSKQNSHLLGALTLLESYVEL